MKTANERDVTIIGGGWSGLMACKHMLDGGLDPVVLEARESVGGVWRYSDDPSITTVMRNTRTTSSRCITEVSDFPMPDDYPHFPRHGQVISYLERYVEHFGLAPHVRCNTEVVSARKTRGLWEVADRNGRVWRSRFLIVCSGLHSTPNLDAAETVFGDFTGDVSHSAGYKHPTAEHEGQRILIFGGGETSSDIAHELSGVAAEVHYAIPNGAWFLRRSFGAESDADTLDSWSSPLRTVSSPLDKGALFVNLLVKRLYGEQGHGQPAWRSPALYYGQFFNKSDDVLADVAAGRVHPHSKVTGCEGRRVRFDDGQAIEVDRVILCTGYHRNFAFLPGYDVPFYRHYLFVFNNDDPSLAFLGFARPVVTSIPFMTEQQLRMVTRVFAGQIRLPEKAVRDREIERDAAAMNKRYARSSRRIDGLVDPMWYTSRISRAAGTFPRFYALARRHPLIALKLVRLPAHGALFMVNDAMHDPVGLRRIVATVSRYRPRPSQMRFYLDTCGGWLLVRLFEDVFRLWLRMTGQAHKYY